MEQTTTNTITQDMLLEALKNDNIEFDAATSAMIERIMRNKQKEKYVKQRHKRAISYMENRKRWRTRVGNPRREVERTTYEALIDYLYEYYRTDSDMLPGDYTLNAAHRLYSDLKADRGRGQATIERNRYLYLKFTEAGYRTKRCREVNQDQFVQMLNRTIVANEKKRGKKVKIREVKDYLQLMKGIFNCLLDRGYISRNPIAGLKKDDFFRLCDTTRKRADQKILSPAQISSLWNKEVGSIDNPRARMVMLSIRTGMREGELPTLRWSDIGEGWINVHSQQRVLIEDGKRKGFIELPWTKDEKGESRGGRFVPIFPGVKDILEYCRKWQKERNIESEFVFCDEKGNWIEKTSYELYLRRHCKSLGFDVTNNHALRMSLNSNVLIPSGFDVRERSLILGHSVEVNEKYYSYAGSFLNPQIMSKAVNVLYPDTDELKIA